MEKETLFSQMEQNIMEGRLSSQDGGLFGKLKGTPGLRDLITEALAEGIEAGEIVTHAITPGMAKVGELFKEGSIFLPEMIIAADTVQAAMDLLGAHLAQGTTLQKSKVILATVQGDVHDIGKNIVKMVLKGAGYEVIDLGVDVDAERIRGAVVEAGARIVGLSALLTTTMGYMREVIDVLKEAGLREGVAVIVGGAPVSEGFAKDVGADYYGRDAFEAVRIADSIDLAGREH